MTVLNLAELAQDRELRILSGKERGEAARQHFHLAQLDKASGVVVITAPVSLYAINASFFLGMFAPSVQYLGGIEGFLRKFSFDLPGNLLEQIQRGLEQAAADRKPIVFAAA